MCSSAPDTSKQDAAAVKMADLSEDQFNWVKQQWEAAAPDRAAATARANKVSDTQIDAMENATWMARDAYSTYDRIYRPQEEAAAREAAEYNTEDRREELAGKARTDVTTQFADQRAIGERAMASLGVNPSDGAMMSMEGQLQRDAALGQVAAGNKARTDAETMGRALRADVINTGRGIATGQATQAGLALNAGNSAVANGTVPLNVAGQGIGWVNQGASQAVNGIGGAANIWQNSSNAASGAASSNSAGLASLAGAGMTAFAI
jgi:hypothetical protein